MIELISTVLNIIGGFTVIWLLIHCLNMFWQIFILWIGSYIKDNGRLRRKYGDWAVVTGGTDGVGKQYAKELADRGINIVIISRNPDKLKKVAKEIESGYGVQTKIIVADFSKGTEIYKYIDEQLKDIPVGILVNNVGVLDAHPMRVCEIPLEKIWEMINVNVVTVASMTRLILPGMLERDRGAVVNVSSGSGNQGIALMTVYSSTKAFMTTFSLALREEYSHTNIDFCCLYPMFISSNMTSFSKALSTGSFLVPDAVSFTKQAINALGRLHFTTGYWTHVLQWLYLHMVPTAMRTKYGSSMLRELANEYEQNSKRNNAKIKST